MPVRLFAALISSLILPSETCVPTSSTTTPTTTTTSTTTPVTVCLSCAANLISVTTTMPGSQAMTTDTTDTTGACAVRTFTCVGDMNPTIQINNGASEVVDADDGVADGSTTFSVTCDADGTWMSGGVTVTQVECYIPCRNCAENLIALSTSGPNPIFTNVVDRTNQCAEWTFTCRGALNNFLDINNGFGVIQDGDDGVVDGTITFSTTCDQAGAAWVTLGLIIDQLECSTQ